jgi:hypothetical protein
VSPCFFGLGCGFGLGPKHTRRIRLDRKRPVRGADAPELHPAGSPVE